MVLTLIQLKIPSASSLNLFVKNYENNFPDPSAAFVLMSIFGEVEA